MSRLAPHIRRGLLGLIIFLMCISVARLLVSMQQQKERIEILEQQVAQLMADTSRLQIPAYTPRYTDSRPRTEYHGYHRFSHRAEVTNPQNFVSSNPQSIDSSDSRPVEMSNSRSFTSSNSQSPKTSRESKFTTPHLFDLNTIDSLTLIRIPGIAERTASVILKNRMRYGGFYDPRQLEEFLTWDAAQAYMDEWCTQWFTADAAHLRRIALNTATISELQRHPYISHDQAIEITRYRTRHRRIADLAELQQLTTFTEAQLQLVFPYLSFE